MQNSSVPPKFPVPWANSAGSANVRSIPVGSQISIQAGAASLTDGFPPLNFVPVSAGGVPPFGQDMNGILRQTTQWLQWYSAGGPIRYDGAFAQSVGGYPAGALLLSNSGHAIYENLVDNNAGDPNITALNWRIVSCVWSATTWLANGSANAQTVTLSPTPTSLNQLSGIPLRIFSQGTNTGFVSLNVNGLGPVPIVVPGGVPLASGSLLTGSPFEVVLQGASPFILVSRTNAFYDNATGGVIVQGLGSSGANVALLGNGNATPNKYIRSLNGALQVVNSAYNATLLNLADNGDLTITGNVIAEERLRATSGALDSGDMNAATILADFPATAFVSGAVNSYFYQRLPSGLIIQSWGGTTATGNSDPVTFPNAFPNGCIQVVVNEGNPIGWFQRVGASVSNAATTVFAAQNLQPTGFQLYACVWDNVNKVWLAAGGLGYRFIAVGF